MHRVPPDRGRPMKRALAAAVLAGVPALAAAAPVRLRLDHVPVPRHLTMRIAAATPAPAPPAHPAQPAPPIALPPATPIDPGAEATPVRTGPQSVSARIDLGYVVDGAQPSGDAPITGGTMPLPYQHLRAYGFGEGYLSTHGVGLPSLSSYLAASFQITRQHVTYDTSQMPYVKVPEAPPIATWFEQPGVQPHAVWLELKDFLPDHHYAPLRIRAGELYIYGPWVLHMTGALAAWDGKLVQATVYAGSRVPDYTPVPVAPQDRATIAGTTLRVDLRALRRSIPISLGLEALAFSSAPGLPPSNHTELELDWRPRSDLTLAGQVRTIGSDIANEHVQLRTRYHQVTNLVVDVTHRTSADWAWDPAVIDPDPMGAKRYLDLGPVLPQLLVSARAGTLIAENVDVYARVALASDLTDDPALKSTFSPSYFEAGGAVELRLRRTVSLGASGLTRQDEHLDTPANLILDTPGMPDALPAPSSAQMGERGFTELGATLSMTLGARAFSASVEVYGRRTNYAHVYCAAAACAMPATADPDTGIATTDTREGGRVTMDAWIGKRMRLAASYELSSSIALAPDIVGYKSLRLVLEGVY